MKSKPKISVIMGIYNCQNTLNEAIDSLLAQTFQDFEVIMCDDGSNDNTLSIAEKYCEKYKGKFTLLMNQRNLGLNKTLNKCLKVAQGEYIARMDGDDISLPRRFEKEVDFLDNNPEFSIVSTAMIFFDESGDWGICKNIEKPTVKDFVKHSPFFCHAPCMIRREAYLKVGGYSEDPRTLRFEDCHLWYKMYSNGFRGYNIQEPLYKMRDDHNAYKRRSLKSRINAIYVTYIGFRMVKMPWYKYIYIFKILIFNILLAIIPETLYKHLHHYKQQSGRN